jgi:hypothetical protein
MFTFVNGDEEVNDDRGGETIQKQVDPKMSPHRLSLRQTTRIKLCSLYKTKARIDR